jgi:hypothetical protein
MAGPGSTAVDPCPIEQGRDVKTGASPQERTTAQGGLQGHAKKEKEKGPAENEPQEMRRRKVRRDGRPGSPSLGKDEEDEQRNPPTVGVIFLRAPRIGERKQGESAREYQADPTLPRQNRGCRLPGDGEALVGGGCGHGENLAFFPPQSKIMRLRIRDEDTKKLSDIDRGGTYAFDFNSFITQ